MDTSTLRSASGQVNSPTSLARVPFRGGFIEAAQLDGEVWVPIRPVCDALGVSLQGQLAKLRGKPWACIKMILSQMPGDDQTRQLAAVDLRSLPLWLATIEPSRVKPEARPALVTYQREAAEVLYRHFLAPPAPIKVPTIPGTIEAARIEALEARVAQLEAKEGKPERASVQRAARVAALVPLVVELVSKQPGIPGATGAAVLLRRRLAWVHAATRAALTAGILENRGSENRPRLYIAGVPQLAGRCA